MTGVGVIDYRAGNAPSVLNALKRVGADAAPVSAASGLADARMIVLPGVGSARATVDSLAELGLTEPLRRRVMEDGVPFLGICIGLQILFDRSDEGDVPCLGFIPGQVRRYGERCGRVPQMGWNRVDFADGRPSDYFYFVNSYHAVPEDAAAVFATADYGGRFCAMVRQGNITACQFHLEKSGEAGLRLLKELVSC